MACDTHGDLVSRGDPVEGEQQIVLAEIQFRGVGSAAQQVTHCQLRLPGKGIGIGARVLKRDGADPQLAQCLNQWAPLSRLPPRPCE